MRHRGEKARPDHLPQFPSARRSRGVVRSRRDSSCRTIGGDRQHRRPAPHAPNRRRGPFSRSPTRPEQRPGNLEYRSSRREPGALQSGRRTHVCAARPRPGRRHCAGHAGTDAGGDFPRLLRRNGPMSTAAFTTTIATRSTAAGRAIAQLNLRQVRLGTLVVATICAGMSALVAVQYRTTFEGALDRSALRALVENPAIRIIFGPPVALDNAGGFTVWRTGTPLLILASVRILLAATRITCGEEDAGRYELLLAGPLRKVSLVLRSIAAVTAAALVISAAVGIALDLTGTDITGAI